MSDRTCEHIQDDGLRCPNRAMYRRQVCYHHWRLLRPSVPVCDPAYVPPTFDCEASISLTTAHILRSLLAGKIDARKAQIAMTCIRETAKSLRLQGKLGDHIETSFTHFMADYFSTLDEIQAKSAAAYPDPQPLIYPAHFADVPEDDDPPANEVAESIDTPITDGLESVDTGFQARVSAAPAAENHCDSLDHRGRAGLQPRVSRPEIIRALAPVEIAPATDNKPPQPAPLSATQSKLLKKILRRGPSHPRFHDAARLLDRDVAAKSG